jgi:HAD superfamily phosphatase (TIGR01668 family)
MTNRVLVPDRYLTSVLQIRADWLKSEGIEALLIDIDNTLVSRDTHEVHALVRGWVTLLKNQGFKLFLVSNNWHQTVLQTARDLALPIYHKSLKPLPINFFRALSHLGVKRKNALVVGDQIMTDIFGAKLAGMRSVLVMPLTETDLAHTIFLRKVEKILLGDRLPEAPAAFTDLGQFVADEVWQFKFDKTEMHGTMRGLSMHNPVDPLRPDAVTQSH